MRRQAEICSGRALILSSRDSKDSWTPRRATHSAVFSATRPTNPCGLLFRTARGRPNLAYSART